MKRETRIVAAVSYTGLSLFAAGVLAWVLRISPALTLIPPVLVVGIGLMVAGERLDWIFNRSV